jgi:hypothetical protein
MKADSIHLSLLVSILFALSGCTSAPPPRSIISQTIDYPYDNVWTALIDTFAELQIPIDKLEKDSGLVISEWMSFADLKLPADPDVAAGSDGSKQWRGGLQERSSGSPGSPYADCGRIAGVSISARAGRFNTFVRRKNEGSSSIQFNLSFQVSPDPLKGDRSTSDCSSTGYLEEVLQEMVTRKLASYAAH